MTDGDKKSFWTTTLAVLTAIAAILTSIVAIHTILNSSIAPMVDLNAIIETASSSRGNVIVVDSIGGGDYFTISDAINAAEDGDTISVRPGRYHEGLVIDKRLRILGDGDLGDVEIKATGENVLKFTASSAEVSNVVLKQDGGYFDAVNIDGNPILSGCDITTNSQSRACIAIHRDADPRIKDNRIHDGGFSGIYIHEDGQGTIENNDIYRNDFSGICIEDGGNPTIRKNEIHGNEDGIYVLDGGQGIVENNNIYENYPSGIRVSGGNPTVTGNGINRNARYAIWIYNGGTGSFGDNDLSDNPRSAWKVSDDSNPLILQGNVE